APSLPVPPMMAMRAAVMLVAGKDIFVALFGRPGPKCRSFQGFVVAGLNDIVAKGCGRCAREGKR
ncbi:MAG TPA: hypothetical protein VLV29_05470, partial [Steroidobacteraceae bacterium]|nr:hypothetical protein [Steroidobacteraceae bacterium]